MSGNIKNIYKNIEYQAMSEIEILEGRLAWRPRAFGSHIWPGGGGGALLQPPRWTSPSPRGQEGQSTLLYTGTHILGFTSHNLKITKGWYLRLMRHLNVRRASPLWNICTLQIRCFGFISPREFKTKFFGNSILVLKFWFNIFALFFCPKSCKTRKC